MNTQRSENDAWFRVPHGAGSRWPSEYPPSGGAFPMTRARTASVSPFGTTQAQTRTHATSARRYRSHFSYPFCFWRVFQPSLPLMLLIQSSLRRPWACTLAKG